MEKGYPKKQKKWGDWIFRSKSFLARDRVDKNQEWIVDQMERINKMELNMLKNQWIVGELRNGRAATRRGAITGLELALKDKFVGWKLQ